MMTHLFVRIRTFILLLIIIILIYQNLVELYQTIFKTDAVVARGHRYVTVIAIDVGAITNRGNDISSFFSQVTRQRAARLSSTTQHAMPPESGRKSGTVYLNGNVVS